MPFLPEASSIAGSVDAVFWFEVAVTVFFSGLIFALIFYFAIRYRRRSEDEIPPQIEGNLKLELLWTVPPVIIVVVMFLWGTEIFIRESRTPPTSDQVFVVGKQWMWRIQHLEGMQEINALHVPVDTPIKLTLTSQDVIHDFSVPAFRIKTDVLPERYTSLWFKATETGEFPFFCDQYCGMGHSHMRGTLYVMPQDSYETWLKTRGIHEPTMAESGAQLYERLGCITCHGTGKGPPFVGIYDKPVKLADGSTVIANDAYLRESIIAPSAQLVAGYTDIMPIFKGQVSEEDILDLIAYIKSLASNTTGRGQP
jgi:cytochrome c oxidase subunit II